MKELHPSPHPLHPMYPEIPSLLLLSAIVLPAISVFFFFLMGFTPCKAEQPLLGMELQEKETQKD